MLLVFKGSKGEHKEAAKLSKNKQLNSSVREMNQLFVQSAKIIIHFIVVEKKRGENTACHKTQTRVFWEKALLTAHPATSPSWLLKISEFL